MPNPIDNLIFDVITEERDFSSRLYLDKNIGIDEESKYSSIFSFVEDSKPESSGFGVYDYLMEIENNKNKIISYNTEGNSKMCVSLPQPYWTNIFDLRNQNPTYNEINENNENNEEKYALDIEQCKGEKYIGTNWNILEDKTIRLKDHSDYCITYNSKPNSRNPYYGTQNKKSKLYLEKCSEDLKNQQFLIENGQVKLLNPEASENKYCLHHNKKNDLKIEECGNKKYTLLWKWGDNIRSVDKCSQSELEDYMKENVNHIKDCINTNYYDRLKFLT